MASAHYYKPTIDGENLVDPAVDGLSTVISAKKVRLPVPIPADKTPGTMYIFKDLADYNSVEKKTYIAMACDLDEGDPERKTIELSLYLPYWQPNVEDRFFKDERDLAGLGFQPGESIVLKVRTKSLKTGGISPPEDASGKFQGRTIIFKPGTPLSMVHELVHGLGMAHLCGQKDCAGANACFMHYGHVWLLKPDGSIDRWVRLPRGNLLCAKHIRAVRETHLEQDAASRKLGW